MGLGKHFKKLKKKGKKSLSKATKIVHSGLKNTGSALKSAAQSELNKYKDLAVGVSKVGQQVVKKVFPNGKDSVAKFLGKKITYVAKGIENGGKVVALVGDMMIVVGTVTGQPELVAAGVAIDEAGNAVVVGAQVAQEAATALQYSIQGDQKAAMIALAKAAEVGVTGFMNMVTHSTFDNFVAAAVDMSEGNFEGASKQLGQAALDAVAGELGIPTQDVIAQTDDTTVVDRVAGGGMEGGMVVPEDSDDEEVDEDFSFMANDVPPRDYEPDASDGYLLGTQVNLPEGEMASSYGHAIPIERGDLGPMPKSIEDAILQFQSLGERDREAVIRQVLMDGYRDPELFRRFSRHVENIVGGEDYGLDVPGMVGDLVDDRLPQQEAGDPPTRIPMEGEGMRKAGGFNHQSHSVSTKAPLPVASLPKPGLASSKNYPASRLVEEKNKGDMFRSPHNLKLRKANTQRGFSGPYKIGKRQAASGLRAVGATMKRTRTIRHMPPNQYKDATYYAIEKMQRTKLRRQDDVLIESDRVTRSMVLG